MKHDSLSSFAKHGADFTGLANTIKLKRIPAILWSLGCYMLFHGVPTVAIWRWNLFFFCTTTVLTGPLEGSYFDARGFVYLVPLKTSRLGWLGFPFHDDFALWVPRLSSA